MDDDVARLLKVAEREVRRGADREAIVRLLRQSGAHGLQAAKVIMALYSVDFGEAQAVISLDPGWKAQLEESDSVMYDILRRLADEDE